jgi:hypothetical protein
MKRVLSMFATAILTVAALAALFTTQPGRAIAQSIGATRVQADPQHLDSATTTCTATGVANTTVTCTLGPPPAGMFLYVHSCTAHEVANAAITGAAGPAGLLTTTNLPNNLIWWEDNATQTTGWQKEVMKEVWPNGLKTAQSGTSFTLASTGGQTTQNIRINCTGWFGF